MIIQKARVGIIGGTGRMGSWLAGLLEGRGHRVLRVGRGSAIRPEDAARSCRVVVVSVPVECTIPVIGRIAPLIREDALLMDLTSVKEAPVKEMLSRCRGQVVGLHPLFGPRPDLEEGPLTVAACRGRGESGFRWIRGLLQGEGYRVKVIDPAEHDRLMAVIQGVNHFSALALAVFLAGCGIAPADLEDWSTPAFRAALDRIRAMTNQPGGLFRSLLTENPAVAEHLHQYENAVKELNQALVRGCEGEFTFLFSRLGAALGSAPRLDSDKAQTCGGPAGQANKGNRNGGCHA